MKFDKAVYKVESPVIAQAKRVGLHKLPKLIQEYLANTQDENINFDKLKIKELQQDNEFLIRNNIELIAEIERLDRIVRKERDGKAELKEIYKENLKELRDLRAKT